MPNINQSNPTLAPHVRRYILSGPSLWCAAAFGMLGVVSTVFLLLTLLHGLDISIALSGIGADFYYTVENRPDDVGSWLDEMLTRFDGLRGQYHATLSAWVALALLGFVFFRAHYRRFSRPQGVSLKANANAEPVVSALLDRFGYYQDIKIPVGETGEEGRDFMSVGRTFYAPKGQVSRILKGKASANQQQTLSFFLCHEYAHVVTRDNLIHSAFLVAISGYTFMFLILIAPMIALMAFVLGLTPLGVFAQAPLALLSFIVFVLSVAATFQGMLISYAKAREFFADAAAYQVVSDGEPYVGADKTKRPDLLSTLSPDLSGFERHLHRFGNALHPRNLLVFFWAFELSIRTMFLLVVPPSWYWLVFVLDGVALVCFGLLHYSLPKRPASCARPLLPWVLSWLAITALFFSGPGILGNLKIAHWNSVSNEFGQLLSLPLLLFFLIYLFALIWMGARRIFRFADKSPKRGGSVWARIGYKMLTVPGIALECCILFVVSGLAASCVEYFASLRFMEVGIWVNLLLALVVTTLVAYLYHQYMSLFFRQKILFAVISVLGASIFSAVSIALYAGLVDVISSANAGIPPQPGQMNDAVRAVSKMSFLSILPIGFISATFYLVLRSLAYWAQGKLDDIELNLEQVANR